MLLYLLLGEKEHICSHTLHEVAEGGDGIISLALDGREVLPPWEELLIYCSIMGDIFDNEHVKEQSLVLTGAYLHELTTLSLWRRDFWVECPQDHFTLYALGEQGGGDDDVIVDRDIYHYGIFFLT